MRRETIKLLLFAGVLGFAVLYGMELSNSGIKDVNGPWEPIVENESLWEESDRIGAGSDEEWALPTKQTPKWEQPTKQASEEKVAQETRTSRDLEESAYDYWEDNEYGIPRNDSKPIVDRLSGRTAEVLHDLSREGIRMVVSIFNKVTE